MNLESRRTNYLRDMRQLVARAATLDPFIRITPGTNDSKRGEPFRLDIKFGEGTRAKTYAYWLSRDPSHHRVMGSFLAPSGTQTPHEPQTYIGSGAKHAETLIEKLVANYLVDVHSSTHPKHVLSYNHEGPFIHTQVGEKDYKFRLTVQCHSDRCPIAYTLLLASNQGGQEFPLDLTQPTDVFKLATKLATTAHAQQQRSRSALTALLAEMAASGYNAQVDDETLVIHLPDECGHVSLTVYACETFSIDLSSVRQVNTDPSSLQPLLALLQKLQGLTIDVLRKNQHDSLDKVALDADMDVSVNLV